MVLKKRPMSPTDEYTTSKRQKVGDLPRSRPPTRLSLAQEATRSPTPDSEAAEDSSTGGSLAEEDANAREGSSYREDSPEKEGTPVREDSPAGEELPAEEESPAGVESLAQGGRLGGAKRKFTERSSSSDPPATMKVGPPGRPRPFVLLSRRRGNYPSESPPAEAPAIEAPAVKAPVEKSSAAKAPAAKAPAAKAPAAKAPAAKAPAAKAPAAKAPAAKAPAAKAPAAKAPAAKAPAAKAPAAKAPAAKASAVKAPVVVAPTAKASSANAPALKAPVARTTAKSAAAKVPAAKSAAAKAAIKAKVSTGKGVAARARKAMAPVGLWIEPSPKQQRLNLEDAIDRVGTDAEEDDNHPLVGLDHRLPVHRYKFFDFVYYTNVPPAVGVPGDVEIVTLWCAPDTTEFWSVPPGHIVPIRAKNQCERATQFLADFGLPWGPRQGDHSDGDESDEIVEEPSHDKRDGRKETGKAVEKVDAGKQVQAETIDKGKKKAVDIVEDAGDNVGGAVPAKVKLLGGRPSKSYQNDVDKLVVFFEGELNRIVGEHNRKMSTVHKDVGYWPVQAEHRSRSSWTAFQKVFADDKEKAGGGQPVADHTKECSAAYHAAMKGLGEEALQEWKNDLFEKAALLVQKSARLSVGVRLAAAKKSVSRCIRAISAEDPEIQIFSGLSYVGDDPAGLQFPGKCVLSSSLLVNAVSKSALPVNQLLNRATGLVRGEYTASRIISSGHELKSGGVPSAKATSTLTTAKVAKKLTAVKGSGALLAVKTEESVLTPDALGRKWALFQYRRFIGGRGNFPWSILCTKAIEGHFVVTWPSSVLIYPGGPGFNVTSLVAKNWVALVAGLGPEHFKEGADTSDLGFKLDPWTQDQLECPRGSLAYNRIPLVISDIGTVLVTVRDTLTRDSLIAVPEDPLEQTFKSSHPSTSFVAKPNIPSTRSLSPTAVLSSHQHGSLKRSEFVQGSSRSTADPRDRSSLVDTFKEYHQRMAEAPQEPIDVDADADMDAVNLQQGLQNSYAEDTRSLHSRGDLGRNQYTHITYSHANRYPNLSHSSNSATTKAVTHQTASYSGKSSKAVSKPTRQAVSYSGQPSLSIPVKPDSRDIFYDPIARGPPSNRNGNRRASRVVNSSPLQEASFFPMHRPEIDPIDYDMEDVDEE